jgi:hypothetical protein
MTASTPDKRKPSTEANQPLQQAVAASRRPRLLSSSLRRRS